MVTVVHHPAFRKLYEDELAQEGLDIAVLPIREMIKQTVTIFVDREKKAVDNLELELPQISDAIATTAELKELTFDEVKQYFIQRFQPLSIGKWKPFQATSTDKRPAVQAQRTMFNLEPCENEFEQEFADFCDYAADVVSFAKNAGPQKLMIDYLRPDGHRAFYVPDYFLRLKNGTYVLVELKGRVDPLAPVKAMAALYAELRQVNDFRNTRVAHIEKKLDSADEAWKALIEWLRCINKMVAIAS
jgi:hypothetical protein